MIAPTAVYDSKPSSQSQNSRSVRSILPPPSSISHWRDVKARIIAAHKRRQISVRGEGVAFSIHRVRAAGVDPLCSCREDWGMNARVFNHECQIVLSIIHRYCNVLTTSCKKVTHFGHNAWYMYNQNSSANVLSERCCFCLFIYAPCRPTRYKKSIILYLVNLIDHHFYRHVHVNHFTLSHDHTFTVLIVYHLPTCCYCCRFRGPTYLHSCSALACLWSRTNYYAGFAR